MAETSVPLRIVWGKTEVVTPEVLAQGTFNFTTGADVPGETAFPLSVLFDCAQVELAAQPPMAQQRIDGTLYAAWAGALRVPVEVEPEREGGVWFRSDLRYFIHKDEGARALLVADLAGENFVREFAYGEKIEAGEFTASVIHQARSLPVGGYAFSLFLVVERRDGVSGVSLRVDSLDVQINPNLRA